MSTTVFFDVKSLSKMLGQTSRIFFFFWIETKKKVHINICPSSNDRSDSTMNTLTV